MQPFVLCSYRHRQTGSSLSDYRRFHICWRKKKGLIFEEKAAIVLTAPTSNLSLESPPAATKLILCFLLPPSEVCFLLPLSHSVNFLKPSSPPSSDHAEVRGHIIQRTSAHFSLKNFNPNQFIPVSFTLNNKRLTTPCLQFCHLLQTFQSPQSFRKHFFYVQPVTYSIESLSYLCDNNIDKVKQDKTIE